MSGCRENNEIRPSIIHHIGIRLPPPRHEKRRRENGSARRIGSAKQKVLQSCGIAAVLSAAMHWIGGRRLFGKFPLRIVRCP
jgi:hypothetical protein